MGTLRARQIFSDSTLKLIAVESVDLRYSKTQRGCRMYGYVEPVAVIVCSPSRAYALDMGAKPVDVDQLRQDLPELDVIVSL